MSTSSEEPKHLDSLCFRRFVMAAWVVAIVCACACPGANALALQDIEKAYDTKLEALGEYRIQYVLSVEYTESGAVTSGHTRIERVLSGEGGYRIEQLIPGDALAPAILQRVQTDNGQQCRTLAFTNNGIPESGILQSASEAVAFYDALTYTPLGLAGLHDSARRDDLEGYLPFMSDVRALVKDPRAVLLEDPILLDGEEVQILEWPAGEPHPRFRFWLSKTRNFALLKCVCFLDEQGEHVPWIETRNTDFEEVAPGLFLPRTSEFHRREMRGLSAQVMTMESVAYELKVRTTPDDFRVAFPEGIEVDNRALGLRYTQGQYLSLNSLIFTLEGLSNDTISYVSGFFTNAPQTSTRRTPAVTAMLAGMVLFIFLLFVLLMVVKSKRRARSTPENH